MDKISVIIPVYNCKSFIRECLDSILHQTYSELEIIVVDDSSTDGTSEFLQQYIQNNSRIIYRRNDNNQNVSACRNIGLALSTGDYVFFIDSDDILHPSCLEKMHQTLKQTSADVAICGFETFFHEHFFKDISADAEVMSNYELMKELALCTKIQNFAWGKLYKKQILCNITFPVGRLFEDVYTIPFALSKANTAVFISDNLYLYRQNPNSLSKTLTVSKIIDFFTEMERKGDFYLNKYKNCLPLMSQSFFELFYLLKEYRIKKNMIPNYLKVKQIYKEAVSKSKNLKDKIKYLLAVI